jgi:hypothetical protein
MLERSEGLADWTKRNIQEVQGIWTHVSDRVSSQSTQLGQLSHLDSHYHSRSQNTTARSGADCVWKLCFYVGTLQRTCLYYDDFYSESTLILTTISMKYCMDIGARPHVCGFFFKFLMFNLTLTDGLCCAWFIYPILCWCWCPEIGTSSIDKAQLSRFHLKMETESSCRNAVCFQ